VAAVGDLDKGGSMGRFDDAVVLITGAARGQGAAEARLFADQGAAVILADVLDDLGKAVATEIGDAARYHHLDVGDPEEWSTTVGAVEQEFGRLDVLVNNAGIFRIASIAEMTLDEYVEVIKVNQIGVWLGMKSVLDLMRRSGGGAIINISSVGGLFGFTGMSAYGASKFAVRGMTKVAALEFAPYGIRVNSVHPGMIDTPMIADLARPNDEWSTYRSTRAGRPAEVADLVAFLASAESSFCNGAEFVIDGGTSVGH
jgi:3alpha(or 20beta)-hydroxysteroid dehydrogenase